MTSPDNNAMKKMSNELKARFPQNPEDFLPLAVYKLNEALELRHCDYKKAWDVVVEVWAIGYALTLPE